MTNPPNEKNYSVTILWSVGVAEGSMSWTTEEALSPESLQEFIEDIQSELGTEKEIFIKSIRFTEEKESPVAQYLEQLKSDI